MAADKCGEATEFFDGVERVGVRSAVSIGAEVYLLWERHNAALQSYEYADEVGLQGLGILNCVAVPLDTVSEAILTFFFNDSNYVGFDFIERGAMVIGLIPVVASISIL